ncbi:hypothetical protein KJ828_02735 [Patescibacteria group bacterium]|nr:hypothetical protein [Patescibacteria group bacterium]
MANRDSYVKYAENLSIGRTNKISKEGRESGLSSGLLKAILFGNYRSIAIIVQQNFIGLSIIGWKINQKPSKSIWRHVNT